MQRTAAAPHGPAAVLHWATPFGFASRPRAWLCFLQARPRQRNRACPARAAHLYQTNACTVQRLSGAIPTTTSLEAGMRIDRHRAPCSAPTRMKPARRHKKQQGPARGPTQRPRLVADGLDELPPELRRPARLCRIAADKRRAMDFAQAETARAPDRWRTGMPRPSSPRGDCQGRRTGLLRPVRARKRRRPGNCRGWTPRWCLRNWPPSTPPPPPSSPSTTWPPGCWAPGPATPCATEWGPAADQRPEAGQLLPDRARRGLGRRLAQDPGRAGGP